MPPIRTDGERMSARRARAKRRYLDLEQAGCHFYASFLVRSPQTCRASRAAASTSLLALDSTAEQIESEAAPVALLWLQDLLVVAVTTFGVLLSSALGVLLFLR